MVSLGIQCKKNYKNVVEYSKICIAFHKNYFITSKVIEGMHSL